MSCSPSPARRGATARVSRTSSGRPYRRCPEACRCARTRPSISQCRRTRTDRPVAAATSLIDRSGSRLTTATRRPDTVSGSRTGTRSRRYLQPSASRSDPGPVMADDRTGAPVRSQARWERHLPLLGCRGRDSGITYSSLVPRLQMAHRGPPQTRIKTTGESPPPSDAQARQAHRQPCAL